MALHKGFFTSSRRCFLPIFSRFAFQRGIMRCKDSGMMDVSHHPSNEWKNVVSFQPHTNKFGSRMSTYPAHQRKPFSLILPRKQVEMDTSPKASWQRLRPGMVLLKNFLTLSEQVEIVNKCEELGVGPGGFYEPYPEHSRLLMCLGRNWDPQMKYNERFISHGSEPPPIPDELIRMAEIVLRAAQSLMHSYYQLPSMSPDICLVDFYTTDGRLALHQDRDESSISLRLGLPVVSISIGDAADFLYGVSRDVGHASKTLLESGDALIFGGESRLIYHGVTEVIPNSAPQMLLKQTMLRPGRLNLTFRQV